MEIAVTCVDTLGCLRDNAILELAVVDHIVLVVIRPDLSLLVVLIPLAVIVGVDKYCKLSTGEGLVCLVVDLLYLYGFGIRSVGRICLEVDCIINLKSDVRSSEIVSVDCGCFSQDILSCRNVLESYITIVISIDNYRAGSHLVRIQNAVTVCILVQTECEVNVFGMIACCCDDLLCPRIILLYEYVDGDAVVHEYARDVSTEERYIVTDDRLCICAVLGCCVDELAVSCVGICVDPLSSPLGSVDLYDLIPAFRDLVELYDTGALRSMDRYRIQEKIICEYADVLSLFAVASVVDGKSEVSVDRSGLLDLTDLKRSFDPCVGYALRDNGSLIIGSTELLLEEDIESCP